jgi:hypothetical protein
MNPLVIVVPILILSIFAVVSVMAAYNRTVEILHGELEKAQTEITRLRVRKAELMEENVRLRYEKERG